MNKNRPWRDVVNRSKTLTPGEVTFLSSAQIQMTINTSTTADNWTVKVTNPDNQVSNTWIPCERTGGAAAAHRQRFTEPGDGIGEFCKRSQSTGAAS